VTPKASDNPQHIITNVTTSDSHFLRTNKRKQKQNVLEEAPWLHQRSDFVLSPHKSKIDSTITFVGHVTYKFYM